MLTIRLQHLMTLFSIACIGLCGSITMAPLPVVAADRVILSISLFSDSIAVEDLVHYAQTGKARGNLGELVRFRKPDLREQFRAGLVTKIELSQVAVANFLYSPQGELLLRRLGSVIKTEAGLSGFSGLRAALILDAADRDGLSLLGVLQKFPIRGLRVDLEETLKIIKDLNGLLRDTQTQTRSLQSQAQSHASSNPAIDFSALPDLRRRGPLSFSKQTLTLQDAKRSRRIEADLYLPDLSADKITSPLPVVVISHGLASDRSSFVYLAEHFASHGYAVAVPEHPGSDSQQVINLVRGWVSEVAEPHEFVDRPLDISYLLDALEQLQVGNLRLDLQHVGVIGQSFGGYTALAVAGAPIQVKSLVKACLNLEESWNVSLALQCRAQVVIDQDRDFRDPRIAAIIAINPMTSALFSAESFGKVQVPTLIVAGDGDTIAPAVREQYPAFAALPTSVRNLMIIGGSTHFSTIEESKPDTPSPTPLAETGAAVARGYMNAVGLAFMDRYVRRLGGRMEYLTQDYVRSIQKEKSSLSWLN